MLSEANEQEKLLNTVLIDGMNWYRAKRGNRRFSWVIVNYLKTPLRQKQEDMLQ